MGKPKRLRATDKKILRLLREGAIDTQVSIATLSKIRLSIVGQSVRLLIRSGYVRKTDTYYEATAKGTAMADALLDIRGNKRKSRSGYG